jgi:hypothetical protein
VIFSFPIPERKIRRKTFLKGKPYDLGNTTDPEPNTSEDACGSDR